MTYTKYEIIRHIAVLSGGSNDYKKGVNLIFVK